MKIRLSAAIAGLFLSVNVNVVHADIKVWDDFNRPVMLDRPAERIISLAPHNTENLYSAGAGGKIVGVVEYSDYPPAAKAIQSVGSHIRFNLEMILYLQPDLVVAWQNGHNKESLQRLEKFGIPVYYSEPRTFAHIIDNIRELAKLSATENNMDPSVRGFEQKLNDIEEKYAGRRIIDVFYQVWPDPLMTLNGDHFISRVLALCGARNLFFHLPVIAPRVSMEAVIDSNPELIITGLVNGEAPDMSMWQKWATVTAVNSNNFLFVDSDVMHRHTLRMLNGISSFCEQIDRVRESL